MNSKYDTRTFNYGDPIHAAVIIFKFCNIWDEILINKIGVLV